MKNEAYMREVQEAGDIVKKDAPVFCSWRAFLQTDDYHKGYECASSVELKMPGLEALAWLAFRGGWDARDRLFIKGGSNQLRPEETANEMGLDGDAHLASLSAAIVEEMKAVRDERDLLSSQLVEFQKQVRDLRSERDVIVSSMSQIMKALGAIGDGMGVDVEQDAR